MDAHLDLPHQRYITEHREDAEALLAALVRYATVKGIDTNKASDGKPFGSVTDDCYRYMLKLAEKDGFDIFDADGWGGHIEMQGLETDETGEAVATASETLGIPLHLDVVPVSDGWTHAPFAGEIVETECERRIYGRGTLDNKGASAAVYTALKALKESGFVPKKNVRLILGLDEETGCSGMYKYLEIAGKPDLGFAPDADFPVIHAEKGILGFEIAKKLTKSADKGLQLRSIEGGDAANSVPEKARAIVINELPGAYDAVKEKLASYREKTGYDIHGKGVGKAFEITAKGKAAHAAQPWLGQNAISILIEFLGTLDIAADSASEFIDFYNERIAWDDFGARAGFAADDAVSGKLTVNPGVISMDSEAVILTFNVRYPVTMTEDEVFGSILPLVDEYNLGIVRGMSIPPLYVPEDDPLVETLLEIYREHTGDLKSRPLVIGGGTYARTIPRAVAFGPLMPGEPDLMHQKDEYITADALQALSQIYADAIYKLAG